MKKLLIIGIIFLFLYSAIVPLSIGDFVRISNEKEQQSTAIRDGGLMTPTQ